MKIDDILNEDYADNQKNFVLNDLEPLHINIIKKIASGDLDMDRVSDNVINHVYELEAGGIIDGAQEFTPYGEKIAQDAIEHGSLEKRNKALRRRPERGALRRDNNRNGMNEPVFQG